MHGLKIPNTNYRFACFTPTTSKFESNTSCGVQSYISLDSKEDYETFDPVYLGTSLLWTAKHLYTSDSDSGYGNTTDGFHWIFSAGTKEYDVDVLVGGPLVREGIEAGLSPGEIRGQWEGDLKKFKKQRERYLIY